MNIFEVEEELRKIINSSSHKYIYYEIFIYFENRESNLEKLKVQEISCYVETKKGIYEFNSTFGTKEELRSIWESLFSSIMFSNNLNKRAHRKYNNPNRNKEIKLINETSFENIICDITNVSIEKIFFNSDGVRKYSVTPYYYANHFNNRRLLFCEKAVDKIYKDLKYELDILESSIYKGNEINIIMLSPRITHLWLTIPLTQIVCTDNSYLSNFTEYLFLTDLLTFSDLPNSNSSIFNDSFDVFGNDYIDRIYINKEKYHKYTKENQRFLITNGQIKKVLTFPMVEVANNISIDESNIQLFYDFVGKVDVIKNYISGILLSHDKKQKVNIKWTSFLKNILGSNQRYSNIKYVIIGRSPYLFIDKEGLFYAR